MMGSDMKHEVFCLSGGLGPRLLLDFSSVCLWPVLVFWACKQSDGVPLDGLFVFADSGGRHGRREDTGDTLDAW